MSLSVVGVISYNGVTWNEKTRATINTTYNYDSAGRTIVTATHRIQVDGYITANGIAPDGWSTDQQMATMRKALSVPGGELHIDGKGFGGLGVNIPGGGVWDVDWGPKPQVLNWESRGGAAAARVSWQCDVTIPECDGAAFKGILEQNFTVAWAVDMSGYTTRTITGHIIIAQTRAAIGDRTLHDAADAYRMRIIPSCPNDFRRARCDTTLSESKNRIDVTVVDEELVRPPPGGIIEVEADYHIQSGTPWAGRWEGSLSATYEVAKDQPRSIAADYFVRLLTSRLLAIRDADTSKQPPFVTSLSFHESIYGRRQSFTITWFHFCSVQQILTGQGLWLDPPDGNYDVWRASLSGGPFRPDGRGYADLKFELTDDRVVDACSPQTATMRTGGIDTGGTGKAQFRSFTNFMPPPDQSYLHYELKTRWEVEDYVAEMKTMPLDEIRQVMGPSSVDISPSLSTAAWQTTDDIPPDPGSGPIGQTIKANIGGYAMSYPAMQTANPLTHSSPSIYLVIEGSALRAGYLLSRPSLSNVSGVPCVEANRQDREFFTQGQFGNYFGVPIAGARFRQRWLLQGVPPNDVGIPGNPLGRG